MAKTSISGSGGALRRLLMRAGRGPRRLLEAAIERQPAALFVLGNQKSGTTAIAALLAELTARSVTLDLDWARAQAPFQRLQRGELGFAGFLRANRLELGRCVVKEPTFTFFVPELRAAFPAARFVFVLRDPRDNIRSILDRLGLPGDRRRLDPAAVEHLPLGWRQVLDATWLGRAPGDQPGDRSGDYIEALAARWNACAEVYVRHAGSMILVRYEDFKADKLGSLEVLANSLGWPPRRDVRGSLDRPFQPRGNAAASWPAFFGANLSRIEDLCGPHMRDLGYGATGEAGS